MDPNDVDDDIDVDYNSIVNNNSRNNNINRIRKTSSDNGIKNNIDNNNVITTTTAEVKWQIGLYLNLFELRGANTFFRALFSIIVLFPRVARQIWLEKSNPTIYITPCK